MSKKHEWLFRGKENAGASFAEHGKFLYQPAEAFERGAETVNKLAERSGEGVAKWKAKIENRVLHLNKAAREEQVSLVKRALQPYQVRNTFNKFAGISNKSAKRAGLLDIGKHVEYEHALQLHQLWLRYIEDVIGNETSPQHVARMLALSDLQGAKVEIRQSSCASYVGLAGIILRETHHAFNVVKDSGHVVLVLKAGSVFTFSWKDWTFHVYGIHLVATPAQRSKRKHKAKLHL